MYVDQASGVVMPQGTQLASVAVVSAPIS